MDNNKTVDPKIKILGKHISNRDLESEYDVYKAMDEYAAFMIEQKDKEAIEFAEWVDENDFTKMSDGKWYDDNDKYRLSTKQLHALFIESKQQK